MAYAETVPTHKPSRFSYARLESIMMSTGTSWDELEVCSGIKHMEQVVKLKGLTREEAQLVAEYMKCDPAYLFMETNDPQTGKYKGYRIVPENKNNSSAAKRDTKEKKKAKKYPTAAESGIETNKINSTRVSTEMARLGWKSRTMLLFLDVSKGCTAIQSQFLHRKTFPLYSTDNLSWMLGVTKEYLRGETDVRSKGTVGQKYRTSQETFLLDVTKEKPEDISGLIGIPLHIARWLVKEPRYVHPDLAKLLETRMEGNSKKRKAVTANQAAAEPDSEAIPKTKSQVENHEKKSESATRKARKESKTSFKPMLDLIQKMDNTDLDKAAALIKALKDLGTSVSNDDFVKIEMVIETQRDYNNAEKNRLEALSMFS